MPGVFQQHQLGGGGGEESPQPVCGGLGHRGGDPPPFFAHQLVDSRGRLAHIRRPIQGDRARAEAIGSAIRSWPGPGGIGFCIRSNITLEQPIGPVTHVRMSSPQKCSTARYLNFAEAMEIATLAGALENGELSDEVIAIRGRGVGGSRDGAAASSWSRWPETAPDWTGCRAEARGAATGASLRSGGGSLRSRTQLWSRMLHGQASSISVWPQRRQ